MEARLGEHKSRLVTIVQAHFPRGNAVHCGGVVDRRACNSGAVPWSSVRDERIWAFILGIYSFQDQSDPGA